MNIPDHLDIKGNKILIVGNRSYKNLGDELILLGTVKLLLQERKEILIAAYDPIWLKKFFSQFIDTSHITFLTELPKGPRSFFRYLFHMKRKELPKYRKADAVIIGGGEILTEENRNSYRYRLASILPCLLKKAPIYLMGGIQVPQLNINRLLFKFLLKRTRWIFARDQESLDELKNFGYKHVEFFMDTSYFAYDWQKIPHQLSKGALYAPPRSEETKCGHIIVNINKNGEQFFDQILEDVKAYIQQGYEIHFVPVSIGTQKEYSDIYFYHKLKTSLKLEAGSLRLLRREADFKYFVEKVANAEMVISTRLHLFLIASFLKVRTKVYPYQKKILKMKKIMEEVIRHK